MSERTMVVVLGGGRGSRLFPLTAVRAKPAVPLAGKYRLIDIPISNAINSGLREIFVLTQFNSASLNGHISRTYRFDAFSTGFVEVLAAEQTEDSGDWFQGTADAVRKHLHRFATEGVRDILILSGDHLYRMDYRDLVKRHRESGAQITVSTIPVSRAECDGFGVMAVDREGMITAFREKPPMDEDITELETPLELRKWLGIEAPHLASMGVYVFDIDVLSNLLANKGFDDFGGDILPTVIHTHRVASFVFKGYWADIGTISAFYDANLSVCDGYAAPFKFYTPEAPVYTHARFLPPSVYEAAQISDSFIADGVIVLGGRIHHSVIGLRSVLGRGCEVSESYLMGADYYETDARRQALLAKGELPIGVGEGASIHRAIIDKNARIGAGCIIHGRPDRPDETHDNWAVRDGIIVVAKNAIIPPGTVL